MTSALPVPLSPPNEYVAGTVVVSTATFVDAGGTATDPSEVTAEIQYGPVAMPVAAVVTRVETGVYTCPVPTVQWAGPGPQAVTVTWTASGDLNAVLYDSFSIVPTGSHATDS